MKALVVGCRGQVGTELMGLARSYGVDAVGVDHDKLDITNQEAVELYIAAQDFEVVINAAAYTAVDKAEDDVDAAFAVNAKAVGYLAQTCAKQNIPLVHISTDYVFDGSKQGAYVEEDLVSPLGVYGLSKLEGEAFAKQYSSQYYIFRTSWVFSSHGNNFVKTMLRLAADREELSVVADQFGKPSSAREIARVIYEVIACNTQEFGTYHLAQPEATSWHGFAKSIFKQGEEQGMSLKIKELHAITTEDYPTPTQRPANSELSCTKLEETFAIKLKPWRESLVEVIKDLRNE